YHVYSKYREGSKETYDIPDVWGYKKLLYKNLYPGIDVEYVFHPEGGLKYSLIVHPGADVSKVKMRYAEGTNLLLDRGKIIVRTPSFGDIMEHPPVTFYDGNPSA